MYLLFFIRYSAALTGEHFECRRQLTCQKKTNELGEMASLVRLLIGSNLKKKPEEEVEPKIVKSPQTNEKLKL